MSNQGNTNIDPNQPYESNVIGFRGIIYFGLGLFLLIVVTFGLMWVFQFEVLEEQAIADDKKSEKENPFTMSDDERLPREPRLQGAPGFGVETKGGRIPLELRESQAEYRELMKQWERIWKEGEKDANTKTVISLSIEDAKEKLLKGNSIKSRSDEEGKKALDSADLSVSASSAGRLASEKVRN